MLQLIFQNAGEVMGNRIGLGDSRSRGFLSGVYTGEKILVLSEEMW